MDDIDKQFEELMKYKKVDLAQMIVLQRISVETLNGIIEKLKRCGNCEYYFCGLCEANDNADVDADEAPCKKWKMYNDSKEKEQ